MKVKEIMTLHPLVVDGLTPLKEVKNIFHCTHYWSIFIGNPDHYIGVVTRQDIDRRGRGDKNELAPISAIMSKGVFSVDENADVEEAIRLITLNNVNGLAVTRNGIHCGIITRFDISHKYRKTTKFRSARRLNPAKSRSAAVIVIVIVCLIGGYIFSAATQQQGSLGKVSVNVIPTVPTASSYLKQSATVTSNYQYTVNPTIGLNIRESDIEQAILTYTNQERGRNGLSALTWDSALATVARDHSKDMARNDFFSHENPAGEDPTARAEMHGYPTRKSIGGGSYMIGIGENIGKMPTGNVVGHGYVSNDAKSVAQALVEDWMNSPGHRQNILNSGYDRLGVGVAYDGTYYYSTQDFF